MTDLERFAQYIVHIGETWHKFDEKDRRLYSTMMDNLDEIEYYRNHVKEEKVSKHD